MPNKGIIHILIFCFCISLWAQKKTNTNADAAVVIDSVAIKNAQYNALAPAKASFLSAVLPGLGQIYNKKYWKVPLVYAGLGTGVYYYLHNHKEYNRYRDAYKSRLTGNTTDEFYFDATGKKLETPRVTTDALQRGQKFYRRNQEIALLVSIGIYALNIIDANVDAHLKQFNVDDNLSLYPHFEPNNAFTRTNQVGLTLNYKF